MRMVNCFGSQFAESMAYYEKIQKYVHSQANINCPGGLEGCVANPNDVRCKMGVKYGETSGTASSLSHDMHSLMILTMGIFFLSDF